MNDTVKQKSGRRSFSWPATIVLSVFLALVLGFFLVAMAGPMMVSGAVTTAGIMTVYVLMLRTGNIGAWRRVFFVAGALLFAPAFIAVLVETRGSMFLTSADVFANETPFCHIVLPMAIIPYLATGDVIFPARLTGHVASVYSMLAIWLIATLTVGRGWCSWVCFYGGWDEGASRVFKKARIKIEDPEKKTRYFNFVMLAFVVLASLGTLTAVYCSWLCPFKMVTEFGEVKDAGGFFGFIFLTITFVGLTLLMPALTRKRFQCMSFCPFGAFQSLVDKVSLYRVRIDTSKCISCGACARECPTLSLTDESLAKGKTLITCTKCGVCMGVCPTGAIRYDFSWARACGNPESLFSRTARKLLGADAATTPVSAPRRALAGALRVLDELASPDALLITSGIIIGSIIMGGFATGTIHRLINLAATGSFLLN